jgi:hypothetical protein
MKIHPTYRRLAQSRWGDKAIWIDGDGRYALLAYCRVLSISLWKTLEAAQNGKQEIDRLGCVDRCENRHEIVDLGDLAEMAVPVADAAAMAPKAKQETG